MKKVNYVAALIGIISTCSCQKEINSTSTKQVTATLFSETTIIKNVYVAGFENNGKHDVAKYWKNGQAVSLTNGFQNATANAIFVSAGNTYVAGDENNGKHFVAKYWKNGQAINLTDGTRDAFATSVYVVGNDVYVAGNEYIGNHYVAKYWKNKIPVTLDTKDSWANSIFIYGTTVFVAGSEFNGTHDLAKYWKNGQIVGVFGTVRAVAYGIFFSNSNLYVLGDELASTGSVLHGPHYLKNNQLVNCAASPGDQYPHASGLFVYANNVFTAGYQWNGQHEVATYWKNGQPIIVGNTSIDNELRSVFVSGSDVFLAGNQYNGSNPYRVTRAQFIKNGQVTLLTNGLKNASANSIFVY
jgi:hypothetical protein